VLTAYIRRALELPPHVAAQKAVQLAGRLVEQRLRRRYDLRVSTFAADGAACLVPRIALSADDVPASLAAILPDLTKQYLDHRFDLLGSGWVQVRYGLSASGLEGHRFPPSPIVQADRDGRWLAAQVTAANLPESQRLWHLIEGPYEPIDWQIDFKSGFRWDSGRHFRDLSFGSVPGVDVKVPWELARLQHLPQLAITHLLAKAESPGFHEPAVYAREVRNQIIDFLAANPPRFGVNWLCPMDVGIRAANMLLAVDLLRAGGVMLDAAFETAVARAATAHARHILAHLEWSTSPRSNHYLSDLAGVLFCAVYLPACDETDAWLDFAAQQLGEELVAQFLPDGGNFEGSTNYHRLSAEIGLFSTAALLGVGGERAKAFASSARQRLKVRPPLGSTKTPCGAADNVLPLSAEAIARLEQAIACVAGWSKPNGRPPQIGDTDSGRLFKLHPAVVSEAGEPREDLLDHRAVVSTGTALFDHPPADWLAAGTWFDGIVARALTGGRTLPSTPPRSPVVPKQDSAALTELAARIRALPPRSRREIVFDLPGLVPEQLQARFFADFGLIVLRGGATYLSLRCVAHKDGDHTMGHYHDDNLTLELYHAGKDLIVDPGSYLYTPLKDVRNRYRSARAHFVPRPEGRSAADAISPFAMRFTAAARLVHASTGGLGAVLEGLDWQALRAVLIEAGRITLLDGCAPGSLHAYEPVAVSDGYGRLSQEMSVTSCTPV